MLSDNTIDILKALFIAIADHELSIEKQRQYLARLKEFEPYATFVRLDRNDIYAFLKDNEFDDVAYEDCQYLVKFFDSDEDGVLNYTDYMQCVITCDDTYLRAAVTQREPYGVNPDEYLSPILERELSILFEKELAYHREISIIKSDLYNSPDFTIEAAFREVDDEGLNFIDHTSVDNFLRRYGFAPTEEELTAIIRRIDVSADASASYAEFEEALKPVIIEGKQSEDDLAWGHHNHDIVPKLANPSKVKMENLRTYNQSSFELSGSGDKHMSYNYTQETKHGSSGKKGYKAEELPISRSYYNRKD